MSYPDLEREEIAQRGGELYQQSLRAEVKTANNIGKIIATDLNIGNYEIDEDLLAACDLLKVKYPKAIAG